MAMKDIAMPTLTFAQAAALPPGEQETHAIPTGSWTLYFHEPEEKSWTPDSYKRISTMDSWEFMGSILREFGPSKIVNGMMFAMRGETSPLWENKANIRGGSYCIKVGRKCAAEVFQRYLIAAALGVATSPENPIVGVTMSPKKGFCIIKLWNADAKAFHKSTDIIVLHEEVKLVEVIYRPHTDQKM
jgi:hypothetical protein